jgi:hypothetical protein
VRGVVRVRHSDGDRTGAGSGVTIVCGIGGAAAAGGKSDGSRQEQQHNQQALHARVFASLLRLIARNKPPSRLGR